MVSIWFQGGKGNRGGEGMSIPCSDTKWKPTWGFLQIKGNMPLERSRSITHKTLEATHEFQIRATSEGRGGKERHPSKAGLWAGWLSAWLSQ